MAKATIQWKGTDVCLDFHCSCGYSGHFDGRFAYQLRCLGCGRIFSMPIALELTEAEHDEGAVQEPMPSGPSTTTDTP